MPVREKPPWELFSYEEYFPYGTSSYRAADSSFDVSSKRYRYTGKERDDETGLYFHGARYYAPWLARWTAADPIGLGDGVNRFRYSQNNPIRLSDPGGTRAGNPEVERIQRETERDLAGRATQEQFLEEFNNRLRQAGIDPNASSDEPKSSGGKRKRKPGRNRAGDSDGKFDATKPESTGSGAGEFGRGEDDETSILGESEGAGAGGADSSGVGSWWDAAVNWAGAVLDQSFGSEAGVESGGVPGGEGAEEHVGIGGQLGWLAILIGMTVLGGGGIGDDVIEQAPDVFRKGSKKGAGKAAPKSAAPSKAKADVPTTQSGTTTPSPTTSPTPDDDVFRVTSDGIVLPPGDHNLVPVDPPVVGDPKWFQIHQTHGHHPLGTPHTHRPKLNRGPDGRVKNVTREGSTTTADDIREADRRLRDGELRWRKGRKDRGGP